MLLALLVAACDTQAPEVSLPAAQVVLVKAVLGDRAEMTFAFETDDALKTATLGSLLAEGFQNVARSMQTPAEVYVGQKPGALSRIATVQGAHAERGPCLAEAMRAYADDLACLLGARLTLPAQVRYSTRDADGTLGWRSSTLEAYVASEECTV